MEYILIFITAIFVNNVVLSQFLGICPFLGVSKNCDNTTLFTKIAVININIYSIFFLFYGLCFS